MSSCANPIALSAVTTSSKSPVSSIDGTDTQPDAARYAYPFASPSEGDAAHGEAQSW